ncbi:hypothetical protein LC040_06690 [Bacillus tianshenii]|nr:hypothetical protein LC040_06690 [Bacillus tianshenii]
MTFKRIITVIMSFLPGLAHMFLGLSNRGIQLMILFFSLGFLTDLLDTFTFLVPIFWVFSLFDALRYLFKKERGQAIDDEPLFPWDSLRGKSQVVGFAFIGFGLIFLFENAAEYFFDWEKYEIIKNVLVGLLFIALGVGTLQSRQKSMTLFFKRSEKKIEEPKRYRYRYHNQDM